MLPGPRVFLKFQRGLGLGFLNNVGIIRTIVGCADVRYSRAWAFRDSAQKVRV